jgi:16S rRNA (guanine(966)-N(2))-methyltransferase RsmD
MRIISGQYARRSLKSPSWTGVRPLLSRLRRALFDTLEPYLMRGPFLDLFGGTGAFAIEALSRGAPMATVIELDPRTLRLIKDNCTNIHVAEPVSLIQADALAHIPTLKQKQQQFAVIAIAPPYNQDLEHTTLALLDQNYNILQTDGLAFVQHPSDLLLTYSPQHLQIWDTRRYGATQFSYFCRRSS